MTSSCPSCPSFLSRLLDHTLLSHLLDRTDHYEQEMEADSRHIQRLERRLREGLQSRLSGTQLNGPADLEHRYPGNVNMSFAYVEGESLIMGLKVRSRPS